MYSNYTQMYICTSSAHRLSNAKNLYTCNINYKITVELQSIYGIIILI